jgi:hypothetical protein
MILLSTSAYAQHSAFNRGTTMIGGSGSVSIESGGLYGSRGNDVTTIALAPRVGTFFRDRQLTGVEIEYAYQVQRDRSLWALAVAPGFIHVAHSETNILLTIGGGVRLLMLGGSRRQGASSNTGVGLFATGGAIILLSESVGATVEVRFIWDRFEAGSASVTGTTVRLALGLSGFLN